MTTFHESFFQRRSFAVIGNSTQRTFPKLTFAGLRKQGKTAYPIDPILPDVDGVGTFRDLQSLPEKPEAAVLEVPKEEVTPWLEKLAAAGVQDIWLHMKTDTPEALAYAKDHGLKVRSGTCAVQYVDRSFPHGVHKLIRKSLGRW